MRLKCLKIGFCDSCFYHRIIGSYSFCEIANEEIGETNKFIIIPKWCPLPDAPNQPLEPTAESSGNTKTEGGGSV